MSVVSVPAQVVINSLFVIIHLYYYFLLLLIITCWMNFARSLKETEHSHGLQGVCGPSCSYEKGLWDRDSRSIHDWSQIPALLLVACITKSS